MSRIDRSLVSKEWGGYWGHYSLWALSRDVSDCFPLVLNMEVSDRGSKPFCFNNYWLENRKFKKVVEEAWGKYGDNGWMDFVLKAKLKGLKMDIREWSIGMSR